MIINKDCPLILSSVFYYDIPACNFNLAKLSNKINLEGVTFDDKKTRNIQIGIKQRENEFLKKGLNSDVNLVINSLIKSNAFKKENIILKAKDGFISNKLIDYNFEGINLLLKSKISKLIIDPHRKKYLSIEFNGKIDVKGLINKPDDITFLDFFKNLDYSNINRLFNIIEDNRKIFFSSSNINFFKRKIENESSVPIKDMGFIKIKNSDLDIINIDQIDKKIIWEEFVWPFCQSILIQFYKQKK